MSFADSKFVLVYNEALESVLESVAAWSGYVFVGEKSAAVAVVGIHQAVVHVDQLGVVLVGQAVAHYVVVVVVVDNNPG